MTIRNTALFWLATALVFVLLLYEFSEILLPFVAGMALAYLRFAPREKARATPSVMTVHNMAFQGYYPRAIFRRERLQRLIYAQSPGSLSAH